MVHEVPALLFVIGTSASVWLAIRHALLLKSVGHFYFPLIKDGRDHALFFVVSLSFRRPADVNL